MDRRQFPRVNAPVFCRPIGRPWFGRKANDLSVGGLRLYADSAPAIGDRLELEMNFDGQDVVCKVEVVWVEPLPAGSPAAFDVGMRFTQIDDTARSAIQKLVDDGTPKP